MQQKQSVGKSGEGGVLKPILGATKPTTTKVVPRSHTTNTKKADIKSLQTQKQTQSTVNKKSMPNDENSSLKSNLPNFQNRFNVTQNIKQQPTQQISKDVMPQTPPITAPVTKQQPYLLATRLAKERPSQLTVCVAKQQQPSSLTSSVAKKQQPSSLTASETKLQQPSCVITRLPKPKPSPFTSRSANQQQPPNLTARKSKLQKPSSFIGCLPKLEPSPFTARSANQQPSPQTARVVKKQQPSSLTEALAKAKPSPLTARLAKQQPSLITASLAKQQTFPLTAGLAKPKPSPQTAGVAKKQLPSPLTSRVAKQQQPSIFTAGLPKTTPFTARLAKQQPSPHTARLAKQQQSPPTEGLAKAKPSPLTARLAKQQPSPHTVRLATPQPSPLTARVVKKQQQSPPTARLTTQQQPPRLTTRSAKQQPHNNRPINQPKSFNKGGVQNRLKVCDKPKSNLGSQPIQFNDKSIKASEIFITTFGINQHPKIQPIAVLTHYCRSKNYPLPSFTLLKGTRSRGTFVGCVNVNGAIFSTYPLEIEDKLLAKELCARRAVKYIKMIEFLRPLTPSSSFASDCAPTIIKLETVLSKLLMYTNKYADCTPLTPEETTITTPIEPIRLPWSDDHWNIYITHCASPVKVWGRLIGADYNVRFGALLNDIDAYMQTKKEHPISIARNNIYLVNINECWRRVRVDEFYEDKSLAQCFFIDFGNADWLTEDQLYICEIQFLSLPAQAVPFSLYDLEAFECYPYAREYVDDLMDTKSLVGRIFTKETEYYDTNSKSYGKIQVVLFDKSNQKDINLNHQLLDTICSATLVPEIKQTGTDIIVTHIKDNGDIYVQVKSAQLKYIQNQLHRITETKFKSDQYKITFEDLKHSKLYLICDKDNANNIKWYRASLAETNIQHPDSDNYLMYFVDHGITKAINISKIFSLDDVSVALRQIPAQAIQVRLYNIPDVTPDFVEIIRDMLPNDCEAFAKVSVPGSVPLVRIFTRYLTSGQRNWLR